MSANEKQVGGDHYKTGTVEHWDWVELQGVGYLEGCASKYVARYQSKGGVQDLEKAVHYVEKAIELLRDYGRGNRRHRRDEELTQIWFDACDCNARQRRILTMLRDWTTEASLLYVKFEVQELIRIVRGDG